MLFERNFDILLFLNLSMISSSRWIDFPYALLLRKCCCVVVNSTGFEVGVPLELVLSRS